MDFISSIGNAARERYRPPSFITSQKSHEGSIHTASKVSSVATSDMLSLCQMWPGGSPRAFRAWPLAWPSPSGPLGWQRSPGSTARRRRVPRSGMRSTVRLEGPARTMRGIPALVSVTVSRRSVHLARRTGRPGLCSRGHRRNVTAGTADLGAGQPTGGGWRARQGFRRKGATSPPPRSRTVAPPLARLGPGGRCASQSRIIALDDCAPPAFFRPGLGPDGRRAGGAPLKPYRKLSQHPRATR